MADTSAQRKVEEWIRQKWMPERFNETFVQKKSRLSTGGVFEFDAVNADGSIVATISTAGATTASGKMGVGKLHKIRSDVLFLVLADADRRLVILTERDMFKLCAEQKESGRMPRDVEFHHADIPTDLRSKLRRARTVASREVSPAT